MCQVWLGRVNKDVLLSSVISGVDRLDVDLVVRWFSIELTSSSTALTFDNSTHSYLIEGC